MESVKEFYERYLRFFLAKDATTATVYDKYLALCYTVRSLMMDQWIETQKKYHDENLKRVYFLSMEYVLGKNLKHNVLSLGIEENLRDVARSLGTGIDEVFEREDDFDLGNGAKGRLAACFQESLATLGLPAIGYGLRYDYAAFRQKIQNGQQLERPYDWLHKGHPWEIIRPEYSCEVDFGGFSEPIEGEQIRRSWKNTEKVIAIPYDVPMPGFRNGTVNTLRLWSARASEEFSGDYFYHSDYIRACEEKSSSGTLTKLLFPEENILRATEMRLKQQFFFLSASLQDIIRRFKVHNESILDLDKKVVIHLNGSRCALAIAEMVRILVDLEKVEWDTAWKIVRSIFTYTSYAVAREDMESWPVYMMAQMFPRHMEIIFELNQRHLDDVRTNGGIKENSIPNLSLIEEGEMKRFRMAHLAVLGSFSVNGISRVQSQALEDRFFPDFSSFFPGRFRNVTAGIAHRRWLLVANAPLSGLITETIGDSWVRDAEKLSDLEAYARDSDFLERLRFVKHTAKRRLLKVMEAEVGRFLDPTMLLDVHVRKIHPSKRQVLHVLGILAEYVRIKEGQKPSKGRMHLFAGKASPSDRLAKQIVHLIHIVRNLINHDPSVRDYLRVDFVPDYSMSWAEHILPAADLVEQIGTPGLEAGGTTAVKAAFNCALIIASKGGSNIELIERITPENLFSFGSGVEELPALDNYRPHELIRNDKHLSASLELLERRTESIPDGASVFPLLAGLRDMDDYYVLHDFKPYVEAQETIRRTYEKPTLWSQMALRALSRAGWFTSDRATQELAYGTWKVGYL